MKKFWQAALILLLFLIVSTITATLLGSKGIDITNKIVVVPIHGEIQFGENAGLFSNSFSADDLIKKLDAIDNDKSVKGVILEIDSPGGTVVASKQVADKVKSMNKPVVALIKETGASGAYWIASASDWIVADDLSVVGSVGVIGSYLQFSGLMEKYGVGYERLVAGEMKDIGSPYRELTPKEKELIQARINEIQQYFLKDVSSSRDLSPATVNKIRDGSFYLGADAKEMGLVDELGNIDDAYNAAKKLGNITDGRLVYMETDSGLLQALSQFSSKSSYFMGRGVGESLSVSAGNKFLSV